MLWPPHSGAPPSSRSPLIVDGVLQSRCEMDLVVQKKHKIALRCVGIGQYSAKRDDRQAEIPGRVINQCAGNIASTSPELHLLQPVIECFDSRVLAVAQRTIAAAPPVNGGNITVKHNVHLRRDEQFEFISAFYLIAQERSIAHVPFNEVL